MNRLGHTRTKGTFERGVLAQTPTVGLNDKIDRDGKTMSVGSNGGGGQERTHGVDKMDKEANSQEGKKQVLREI